jgi:hypothetical protein
MIDVSRFLFLVLVLVSSAAAAANENEECEKLKATLKYTQEEAPRDLSGLVRESR